MAADESAAAASARFAATTPRPDYFVRFEHAYHYNNFATPPAELARVAPPLPPGTVRHLDAMDVYAGAGGTSFLAQRGEQVTIESRWSVDLFDDAVLTFAANHPDTHVRSRASRA